MPACIVVEWENAIRADDEISRRLLAQLSRQCGVVSEVRFVFDPGVIDAKALGALISEFFSAKERPAIILQPVRGHHYYGLKNEGAAATNCDVVLFIDSDVVPCDEWVHHMLEAFQRSDKTNVVAGFSHLDPEGVVGSAFAAGWFFPMEHEAGTAKTVPHFFANNVGFRRDYFLARRFADMPAGVTRGACTHLARRILAEGSTIAFLPQATVRHPAPNGWRHIVVRGLAQGRDACFINNRSGLGGSLGLVLAQAARVPWQFLRVWWRMAQAMLPQGGGGFSRLQGASLMAAYQVLIVAGALVKIIAPSYAKRAWRI